MPPAEASWDLTAEQRDIRDLARRFADEQIAPFASRWDREHHFPVPVVRAMGELGLFGLVVPEEYGGSAGDFTSLCLAIEELGRVDQSFAITVAAHTSLGPLPHRPFTEKCACPLSTATQAVPS